MLWRGNPAPHLDQLAAGGLSFTRFYNTARCWASRASLLAGHYPQSVRRDLLPEVARGGYGMFGTIRGANGVRPTWATMISFYLHPLNYRSYSAGKWHMDGDRLPAGFDRSYSLEDHNRFFNPKDHSEDDVKLQLVGKNSGDYSTRFIADHAIKCLKEHAEKHSDRPFFEYLAFTAPHFPLHVLPEDIAIYQDRYREDWDAIRKECAERLKKRRRRKTTGCRRETSGHAGKTIVLAFLDFASLIRRIMKSKPPSPLFLALAFAFAFALASASAQERPNILFISVDDLNDMPTFMGRYPDAKTPHMDRLASRGMTFTNAHSPYPLCGPARASVMTSTLATSHGYHDHVSDEKVQQRGKEMGTSTLPEFFKDNGYHVMAVGKLFHHHVPKGTFDESGSRGDWNPHPEGRQKYKSGKTLTDWARWPGKEEDMSDPRAAEWAVERLKKSYDKPFLMMVGFIRPHVPWVVPDRWFDLYPDPEKLKMPPYKADDLDDVPERSKFLNILTQMPRTEDLIKKNQWHEVIQAYLASCSFVDHYIGQVIKAVETSPHSDNTIIVLWSDHGYHLGEKNTFQKQSLWERSSHVPLVFAGPGIAPKQICGRVVSLIDILPTLAGLCGLPARSQWEGRNIRPLLEDPAQAWDHPVLTTWQGRNYAIQTERYRYIRYDDGSEELYDHQNDLKEWTNLAKLLEYEPVKKELKTHIPENYVGKSVVPQQKIRASKPGR